ncbi:hypothetical protein [Natrononativus amylolyticus]|uniref:hypothetical protein n=1 Tax=Natrononativus amylolyticus TaxID=2963434 RepID=UPI0020CF0EA5|nr:hypothetical protein [Natrononativus amylolyticus]
MSTVGGLVLAIVTLGLAAAVYHDSRRVGFSRPALWATLVFVTVGFGGVLYLVVGAPAAGALVVALAGLVFYAFEREDTVHGDEPADPHALPGSSGPEDADGDER